MRIFSSSRRKLTAVAVVTGIAIVPFLVFGAKATWGPARTTFTWANPASYITLNSITDNPVVGDERTFYTAAESGTTTQVDKVNVHDNEEVTLRVYFHNNAASNLNLVATNTRVKMLLPTAEATSAQSTASITADNANPSVVTDTVDFTGSQPFTLEYETGSAKLWTNYVNGVAVSDSVVSGSGALVGTNGPDGKVPGCSQFSGYVTIKVKVHVKQTPPPVAKFSCTGLDVNAVDRTRFDFTAHGSASNAVIQSYTFTVKNSSGGVVDTNTVNTSATSAIYHFNQSNAGTYTVSAVVNTDHGSTSPADCIKTVTVKELPPPQVKFACTGLDVKEVDKDNGKFDFTAHGTATNAVIQSYAFTAKDSSGSIVDTKTVNTSGDSATYNFGQSKAGTYTVSAVVNTDKGSTNSADCTKQVTVKEKTPTPVFACKSLSVTQPNPNPNRTITAKVDVQAEGGATFRTVTYDFGDGSTKMTDQTSVDHSYAKDGTYTVAATLSFNVGDTTKTVRCASSVTITTPVTPPATPPQVLSTTTPLPNTGAGDILGLFAGASGVGAAGHYVSRRFRRGQ